jgi:hypothetical protein
MIVEARLPEYYWPFALDYSLTVLNLTPQMHRADKKAPFTLLAEAMGRNPNECEPYIFHLRRWGCICWILTHPLDRRHYEKGRKAKERAELGRFLGFEDIHGRVVLVYHCRRNQVIRARDVTFMEDEFDLPFVEFDDIWPTEEPEDFSQSEQNRTRLFPEQQYNDIPQPSESVRISDSGPSRGGSEQQVQKPAIQEPLTPISLPESTLDISGSRKHRQPSPITTRSKRVRIQSTRNQFDINFGRAAIDLRDDVENRHLDLSMSATDQ